MMLDVCTIIHTLIRDVILYLSLKLLFAFVQDWILCVQIISIYSIVFLFAVFCFVDKRYTLFKKGRGGHTF